MIDHRRSVLGIATRRDLAERFVVEQHLDRVAGAAEVEQLSVEADAIGRRGAVAELRGPVVDRDATRANPFFDAAAGAVSRAGKQLLQPFTHVKAAA